MITKINGIDYFPIPANGQTSLSTTANTLTILSSLFVDEGVFSFGDSCRIKTLFTKLDSFSTVYDVTLYWNTGITTTGAVKLAEVAGVNNLTRAINIERNIRFNLLLGPTTFYVTMTDPNVSKETDIGIDGAGPNNITYNYSSAGYYLACGQRTSAPLRFEDNLFCSYIYIDK
jgi:hypothetical protein